jgi:hypothetical protein
MGTFYSGMIGTKWSDSISRTIPAVKPKAVRLVPILRNVGSRLETVAVIRELGLRNSAFSLRVLSDSHYHATEVSTD